MRNQQRFPRSSISILQASLLVALGVLPACGSVVAPGDGARGRFSQAANGDWALTFLDTSQQRSGGGDWDACRGKADCAPGETIAGLSEIPGGANRTALCRAAGGALSGDVTATLTTDGGSDWRRAARAGDWAQGYWKLECGEGEYVSGVSEDADQCEGDTRLHAVRCAAGGGLSDACQVRLVDGSGGGDDRGSGASGDWDVDAFKGECSLGQYVAGVSVAPSTGRAHSILCCDVSGGGSIDTLAFMRNTHGGTLRGSDGSIVSYAEVPGANRFYYVKGSSRGNDGRTFERYGFDGSNVWLERDTSWPLSDGAGYDAYDCVDPASHRYGSLVWARRSWNDGDRLDFTTQIIGFAKDACQWSSSTRNNTNSGYKQVHHVDSLPIGDDVGAPEAIGIDYGPCETHWYARGWGWVKWEYHDVCGHRPGPDVTWSRWSASAQAPVEPCNDAPLPMTAP